ncbi:MULTISPECIES: FkbM family methyltransferase [unclassified Coleofasciculus]|uniref:FkbM family methyltransferase n=1 Tax=unclassified Coleofasciculus TaxID=2692782 RepID=UPI001882D13D|nr:MULTISPECIES: FkbM family methyltransferase [unclassified Coleofasciculus]MBE9127551.1 FkbM family methyltransferase [Coleofasciculus sp. LEGE 07081]MBE9147205.1 FkbM family methyltransferase [Coleofasciculus sp. LEGE 07092]
MSTVSTIFKLINHAQKGIFLQDKWLAFLIAGLGVMGHHRVKLRLWFIRLINNLSVKTLVKLYLNCNGRSMYFSMRQGNEADYLMGGELVRGTYEIPDFEPKTIIDGGANIGVFAIHALSYFPKAKLICYEPDLANFYQLQNNLELNRLQADTHQLGLWSKNTTLYYHAQSSHTGFVDEHPPGVPIVCTLPKIEPNCWLKLDIEGAEYEVLPTLLNNGQYPRWISMEIHYFDTKGQSLLALLREHGYTIKGSEDYTVSCTLISAYQS